MSVAILATKLYIPPPRLKIVLCSRLIERLNEGLHRKPALLSAPAGFGKTTLISDWVTSFQGLEPKVGVSWLTLEEGDKDLTRFLADLPLLSSGRLQQVLVCPTISKREGNGNPSAATMVRMGSPRFYTAYLAPSRQSAGPSFHFPGALHEGAGSEAGAIVSVGARHS